MSFPIRDRRLFALQLFASLILDPAVPLQLSQRGILSIDGGIELSQSRNVSLGVIHSVSKHIPFVTNLVSLDRDGIEFRLQFGDDLPLSSQFSLDIDVRWDQLVQIIVVRAHWLMLSDLGNQRGRFLNDCSLNIDVIDNGRGGSPRGLGGDKRRERVYRKVVIVIVGVQIGVGGDMRNDVVDGMGKVQWLSR